MHAREPTFPCPTAEAMFSRFRSSRDSWRCWCRRLSVKGGNKEDKGWSKLAAAILLKRPDHSSILVQQKVDRQYHTIFDFLDRNEGEMLIDGLHLGKQKCSNPMEMINIARHDFHQIIKITADEIAGHNLGNLIHDTLERFELFLRVVIEGDFRV
jgi:hypothetical protein